MPGLPPSPSLWMVHCSLMRRVSIAVLSLNNRSTYSTFNVMHNMDCIAYLLLEVLVCKRA